MAGALDGRVAVVTGASRGIGAAIAHRCAAEGAAVALVARTALPGASHLPGSLGEVATAIEATGGVAVPIVADLADPATDRPGVIASAEAALGPVDILVNNAAACFYLPFDETSERRLRVAFEVNVITPYLLTQAVVASRRAAGRPGWILNIGSGIAEHPAPPPATTRLGPTVHQSTYAPSKAALDRLTTALALELHGDRIAVNAVAPQAAVHTEGAGAMLELPDALLEPVESIAEAALALVGGDPDVETGIVTRSLDYLRDRGIRTRTLDGRAALDPDPAARPAEAS